MNPPDSKAELLELCDRLLDGDFTVEDRQRLEALVLGDAELRRFYVEIMHEHAALRQSASRLSSASLAEVLRAVPEEESAKIVRGRFPRWPLQLAAAVAVCFGVWWLTPRPAEKPLAKLVETNGARWDNSSLPTTPGSPLRAGRLRFADGVARIVFQSGAEVS